MADIGTPTPQFPLHLPTVGDFRDGYRMEGEDFPAGAELYLLIGRAPTPNIRWDYTISGDTATLKVEAEDLATVANLSKYWLMYCADPTSPRDDYEIQTGTVTKVNA